MSYGRHYEQLQDEQNAQILTQENLLSKNQRVEVANVLLRQENSRLSRGPNNKNNMMISLRMKVASLKADKWEAGEDSQLSAVSLPVYY